MNFTTLGQLIKPAKVNRAGHLPFPVLSMTMHNGLVDQADKFKKRVASADTSQYKVIKREQLVVGFPIDEGVLAFQNLYDAAIVSPAYDVWDIKHPDDLDCNYLERFLRSPIALTYYSAKLRGTTARRRTLPDDVFLQLPVPYPPLVEQKRIVAVLDKADELRQKRGQALARLDQLTQSVFLDMFGDPVTNPMRWPVKSLGEVAREKANNGIFRKNPEYNQDGSQSGLPVVWVEDLFRGASIDIGASRRLVATEADVEKYGLHFGDILFCRSSLKLDGIAFNNVFLGRDQTALFECHLIRVSPDLNIAAPIYLNSLLRLPEMRAIAKSKSKTATMTTIDQTSLCSIPLMLPPVDLQRKYACRVVANEKLRGVHDVAAREHAHLINSLQQRSFSGDLNLHE